MARSYSYVGPAEIAAAVSEPEGAEIGSVDDLRRWLEGCGDTPPVIATFTVDAAGVLRLAPRRSEHIACAGGGPVLAAGELTISESAAITGASNQSTGFCPEPSCWEALARTLDTAGIDRPEAFTAAFVFRRCPACGQRCIVKDDWFVCEVCGASLPESYNF